MTPITAPFKELLRAARLKPICGNQQYLEARNALLRVLLPGVNLADPAALQPADGGFSQEWMDQNLPAEKWTEDQVEALAESVYSKARTVGAMEQALLALRFFDHALAALAKR